MLREAKKEDLTEMIEIIRLSFEKISIDKSVEDTFGKITGMEWWERKGLDIKRDFASNPHGIFVNEIDGKITAFITTFLDKESETGRVSHLAVRPGFQGKGLGQELMEYALSYLKNNGMKLCRIEATDTNTAAIRLYKKLGFKMVSVQVHLAKLL